MNYQKYRSITLYEKSKGSLSGIRVTIFFYILHAFWYFQDTYTYFIWCTVTKFFFSSLLYEKKAFYTNFSSHFITITIKSCLDETSIIFFSIHTYLLKYLSRIAKFFRVDGRTQAFLIRTANDGGSWKY